MTTLFPVGRFPHTRHALAAAAALALLAAPALATAAACSFSNGNYSASGCAATLADGDTLALIGGGYKYLDLVLTVQAGAVVTATDALYFSVGSRLDNAGTYAFGADTHLYNSGGPGQFVNTGTLVKTGGAGDSYVSITGFTNDGGTVGALTGRIVFNVGAAFNAGSSFTGPGQVVVTGGAAFSGSFSSDGSLVLAGGSLTGDAATPARLAGGSLQWTNGVLAGSWETAAGTTMNLIGGGYKYLGGTLGNAGTVAALDHLYINDGATLVNTGRYEFGNDTGLYNSGGPGGFVNSGVLAKTGGAGDSYVSISGYTNAAGGLVDVQSGRIVFNNNPSFASGSVIAGSGQAAITAGATISGALSTAGNLYLNGGTVLAEDVVASGDVHWTNGTLTGSWQTAAGSTLYVDGGGYKYVGGTLSNAGTMTALDNLYINSGASLVNSGRYEFGNDAGLYNSGGPGGFVNSGVLAKTGGAGDSYVSISGYTNAAGGIVDVQSGRIVFNNNPVFASGSVIAGSGQVAITAGAAIDGALSTAGNLYLTGGTVTAANVVASGGAHWTNGTLSGQWQSADGSALSIEGGGYKYAGGLTLAGRTVATDHLYAYGSGALTNQGRYELASDHGLYGGGEVVNQGLIVKTGGAGASDLASVALRNLGTLAAESGTLRLPTNFSNEGVLAGTATLQWNGTLLNEGHIAPGSEAAPGTLTLAGNLVQAAGGTLDIRLTSASLSDLLLVSGTAALGGSTLALDCFACTLAEGDSFLLLSSSGTLSGSFGTVTTSGFGAGFEYALDYGQANQVWLTVLQVGAVPEPASYAMLLAGVGVVGWLARRRRMV